MFQSYQNIMKRMMEVPKNQEQIQQLEHDKQDSISTEYLVRNWLEALFAWFQVIVLWHEPRISICAISGLLSSFLLLTYFAPRFYATIIILTFLYNLNKFWFRHVWPDIRVPLGSEREEEMRLDVDRWTYLHPQLMTLNELQNHISNLIRLGQYYLRMLLVLRNQRPTAFCSLLCSVFTITAYLGTVIGDLGSIFCALIVLMSAPGVYAHLLNEHQKAWLKERYQSMLAIYEHSVDAQQLSEHKSLEEIAYRDQQKEFERPKTTSDLKEIISNPMTTTMRSLEQLFGNLRKRSLVTTTTISSDADETIIPSERSSQEQQHPTASLLSNFKTDGAKVLYNLIDTDLMSIGSESDNQQAANSSETIGSQRDKLKKRFSDKDLKPGDSIRSLLDDENNEDDQQDEGFVML